MNGSGRGIVLYPAGGGAPRVVVQPDERTHPVRVGREQDAGIAFFPPGGAGAGALDALVAAFAKLSPDEPADLDVACVRISEIITTIQHLQTA